MSRKLFALEEIEEVVTSELEATPEEGEVADVQVEVEEEVVELEGDAGAIEEGVEATDQLEEVEELVEQAVEEGEGLDPVAAEAIAIAVRAIGARVGARTTAMSGLYAAENFSSASSRKANTTFALEGVREFLKDMWKKIKTAVDNLWAKVKAFFEKHISSLGRIKKALDSAKSKLAASSGKLDTKAYLEETPGSLASSFGHVGEVSAKTIGDVIAAHAALIDQATAVTTQISDFNGKVLGADLKAEVSALAGKFSKNGAASGTLVGGVTIAYTIKADGDDGAIEFEVEKTQVERADKGGVSLSDKAGVKGLLDSTLAVINNNIKVKDKQSKLQESFNKLAVKIEKAISDAGDGVDKKDLRNGMKAVYKLNAKAPTLLSDATSLNIRLAKAVLGYAGLCIKHYK